MADLHDDPAKQIASAAGFGGSILKLVPFAPKRRWFQFSLRTQFVLLTVFAVWLGWNLHIVRQREHVLGSLKPDHRIIAEGEYGNLAIVEDKRSVAKRGLLSPSGSLPISWRLLGARPIAMTIYVQFGVLNQKAQRIRALFPESQVVELRH
jgi:hypothetical protein